MACIRTWIKIAGRGIKIANGTRGERAEGISQTINVCDQNNDDGDYEQVYRVYGAERFLHPEQILAHARTLEELDAYLNGLGFVREGPRHTKTPTTILGRASNLDVRLYDWPQKGRCARGFWDSLFGRPDRLTKP